MFCFALSPLQQPRCADNSLLSQRIRQLIRKDKPSTKTRAKGLAERIDLLRKDYADIVTEDELKGYEAILEKVKSEIPPKPEKDEKQN